MKKESLLLKISGGWQGITYISKRSKELLEIAKTVKIALLLKQLRKGEWSVLKN